MKEAWAHRAIDLNDDGVPGSVADRRLRRELAEVLAEAARDLSKLRGGFHDVLVVNACFIFQNQLFDLFFECIYLFHFVSRLAI